MPVGFFCCRLNVLVCTVAIIFCFAPLFAGLIDGDENRAILEEIQNSTFFRDASLSTLLVTIPSAVDAVIDMFLNVCDAVTKTVSHEKFSSSVRHLSSKTTAVRLSPSERLGFIIGISSLSYFSIWSTFQPLSLAFYYSFANFSTIMSVCPIVFFLKRCTKLWTPFRSFSLILCISGGSVLSSLSFCFKIGSYEYILLTDLASTSIGLATFVLSVVCAISIRQFAKNNHESWKRGIFSGALVTYFFSSIQHSRESVKFYKHCVVEIHTIGLIVLCVTNVVWYSIEDDVVSVTSYFMCVQTAIAVMIFVVEIRIRQTEVLRGLDLLDSKRSFVRYISHEIRTPLSTVMMGLDLLVSGSDVCTSMRPFSLRRLKSKPCVPVETEADSRHSDTVLLIQESCRLAVEICDDLLNYETFEDDEMSLVRKTMPAAALFSEILQPFQVQARRNGVTLYCDIPNQADLFDNPMERAEESAFNDPSLPRINQFYGIQPTPGRSRYAKDDGATYALQRALIDVDRRRIAHVLRNIVSNALNFTPTGGEVNVSIRLSSKMGPKSHHHSSFPNSKGGFGQNASKASDTHIPSLSSPVDSNRGPQLPYPTGVTPPEFLSFDNCIRERDTAIGDRRGSAGGGCLHPPICGVMGLFDNVDTDTTFFPTVPLSEGRDSLPEEVEMVPGSRRTFSGAATPGLLPTEPEYGKTRDRGRGSLLCGGTACMTCSENVDAKDHYVSRKKDPRYFIVEVTDTGAGIAKENLERIFKEIVRFDPNELHGGCHGGSGLGMVLSKGIVEAHGGKLWLTSEGHGRGCTFGFGLPLSKAPSQVNFKSKTDTLSSIQTLPNSGSDCTSRCLSPSIDAQTKSFHSSVVAALTGLGGGTVQPCGTDLALPPLVRPLRLHSSRAYEINKVAFFKDPLHAEDTAESLRRGPLGRFVPERVALDLVALSKTPDDDSRSPRDDDGLSLRGLTSRSLTPRANFSEGSKEATKASSKGHSSIADFIPEVKDVPHSIAVLNLNRDGVRTRSHSVETIRRLHRPRSIITSTPKHALIVEDSAVCRRMTGKVLQSLSITFEEAEDGLQAIEKVQVSLGLHPPSPFPTGRYDEKSVPGWCGGKPFDLILCDNVMPNMCGPAAVKIIREIGYFGPIFGVTGNMLARDVEEFVFNGADIILGKPLKISALSAAVRHHLRCPTPSGSPTQDPGFDAARESTLINAAINLNLPLHIPQPLPLPLPTPGFLSAPARKSPSFIADSLPASPRRYEDSYVHDPLQLDLQVQPQVGSKCSLEGVQEVTDDRCCASSVR